MPTLKDIAKETGLSIPTVSRILNPKGGHIPASAETIKRVRDVANKLNYTPNALAQSLSTNRTRNIALLLDSARNNSEEDFYWAPTILGITKQCQQEMLGCMISLEDYRNVHRLELPLNIREKKVDGFIATHPIGMNDSEFIDKLIHIQTPFVVISSFSTDPRVWSVVCDPSEGYRKACRHLTELGHRKIGYMTYPEWNAAEDRTVWSPRQLSENSLCFSPVTVDLSQYQHEEIAEQIAEKIATGELDITALFIGDVIGIHLTTCLAAKGIRVPEDFSIVAFDDSYACRLSSPKLTSIHSPLEEMGRVAVSMLSEKIKSKQEQSDEVPVTRHLSLPRDFVIRESTGPAPQ